MKLKTYFNFNKDNNYKFKVGDYSIMSKYKNIFAEGYVPNQSKEVFVIKKVKNTVSWTYLIKILTGKEILDFLANKSCKNQIKKRF